LDGERNGGKRIPAISATARDLEKTSVEQWFGPKDVWAALSETKRPIISVADFNGEP
jgi:hypothetical protein